MGPSMEEMPDMELIRPTKIGRFSRGMMCVRTTADPENMPSAPMAAIARPTMNAVEFVALPHIAEPTSKIPTAMRKTVLVE
jgi:hypothetical protein